jgi:PQQ-like domain
VFVSNRSEILVFDLATGVKLRSAKVVHTRFLAAGDALVAANAQEEFGLDKRTLRPTWRAPTPNYLGAVGGYVLETPLLTEPTRLRLRRASDGVVMWENEERLFAAVGMPPQLDGDTLYVPAYFGVNPTHVAAIDVASGVVRWRAKGYLRTASSGRVVIQDAHTSPPSSRILDAATGHVRWHTTGAWMSLHGDIAYAGTPGQNLTAIDLSTNRVLWRRTGVSDAGGDDKWLYGITSSRALKIMERTTGEIVGEMQLGERPPAGRFRDPLVVRVGNWLFALGPLAAPEQRKPVVVRGCLIVQGCGSNSYAPEGAKVTIDDTTVATTDRRGCFKARATLGLGPARVDVASGTKEPLKLDTDFPEVVVFSGPPVTLRASDIGAGCNCLGSE